MKALLTPRFCESISDWSMRVPSGAMSGSWRSAPFSVTKRIDWLALYTWTLSVPPKRSSFVYWIAPWLNSLNSVLAPSGAPSSEVLVTPVSRSPSTRWYLPLPTMWKRLISAWMRCELLAPKLTPPFTNRFFDSESASEPLVFNPILRPFAS